MKKNVYDEKIYLKGDKEALDSFRDSRKEFELLHNIEYEKYGTAIREYNKYLLMVKDFLTTLDLNNSLEYSIALSYLIKNGYFTYDRLFRNKKDDNELASRLGISIISGCGCCRNIADLSNDLLNALGYYSNNFYCYAPYNHLPKNANTKLANHVANLVEFNGVKYVIDLLNECILYGFDSSFVLKEIALFSDHKIRYKPYFDIILNQYDLNKIFERLKEFEFESKKKKIKSYDYENEIKLKTIIYMSRHKDLCMDFHNETKELKEQIALKLKK